MTKKLDNNISICKMVANYIIMKKEQTLDDFRHMAIEGFVKYQACKYDLSGISPLQEKRSGLVFKGNDCYIGDLQLEETTYLCDSGLPNIEVPNVLLEVVRHPVLGLQVILKVNFFGMNLVRVHTKEDHLYLVGIPNNFMPTFRVIAKRSDLKGRQKDSMV